MKNKLIKEAAKFSTEKLTEEMIKNSPEAMTIKTGLIATKTAGRMLKRPLLKLLRKIICIIIILFISLLIISYYKNIGIDELVKSIINAIKNIKLL